MVASEKSGSWLRAALAHFITALKPEFDWKAAFMEKHHQFIRHLPPHLRLPVNLTASFFFIHIGFALVLLHAGVKEIRGGFTSMRRSWKNPFAALATAVAMGIMRLKTKLFLLIPCAAFAHFYFNLGVFDIFKWATFRLHPQLHIKPQLTLVSKAQRSRSDPTLSLSAEPLEKGPTLRRKKSKSTSESHVVSCSCAFDATLQHEMLLKLERELKKTKDALQMAYGLTDVFYEDCAEHDDNGATREDLGEEKSEEEFVSASEDDSFGSNAVDISNKNFPILVRPNRLQRV
ncbi:hypothetical protein L596_007693 [Steinernema carpocapsae]|uniref:Uncharacterized protein n=1 Tax=Steinernema carpocapsae TaxID=34508 RepID=A0A4U5PB52_STECR|nr:hypothetical protein L596_007693 [Steinernema carpocapsae]